MKKCALLIVLLVAISTAVRGQSTALCGSLPPRLVVGQWARVTYDTTGAENVVNLREDPSTQRERVGTVQTGDMIFVTDGPVCSEGLHWWQIEVSRTGMLAALTPPQTAATADVMHTGWVAEGLDAYWFDPLGSLAVIEGEDGLRRVFRVDDQGEALERAGCVRPPDVYTQIEWGFATFNVRTVTMLQQAQRLYSEAGGFVRLEDMIVQGSYTPGVSASFGTHDAGGAVDISVRSRVDFSVLSTEIPLLLDALRTAGFAAWLRRPDELYPGSPIHIHAIAIGDAEQSQAARDQVDGEFGYLRGYNGLPQADGNPALPDLDGAPVLCEWMLAEGYRDLRD